MSTLYGGEIEKKYSIPVSQVCSSSIRFAAKATPVITADTSIPT